MGFCDCCCLDGFWPKVRLINNDIIRGVCPKPCVDDWAWDSLFRDLCKVTFKKCGCKHNRVGANESWQKKKLGCKSEWPKNYGRIAEMTRCTGCNTEILKKVLLQRKECKEQKPDWYVQPSVPYCQFPPDDPSCEEYDEDLWNRLGENSIGDEFWFSDEWMKGLNELYSNVVSPPEELDEEHFEPEVTEEGKVVEWGRRRSSRRRRRRSTAVRGRAHHFRPSKHPEHEVEFEPEPEPLPSYRVRNITRYPSLMVSEHGRKSGVKIAFLQRDQKRQSPPLHIAFTGEPDPLLERENKPRMSYVGSNVFYGRAMKHNREAMNQKDLSRLSKLYNIEIENPEGSTERPSRTPRIAFRSQIDARLERENKPRMSYVGSNVFYGREMKRNSEVDPKDLAQFQNNGLPNSSSKASSAVASGVSVARSNDPSKQSSDKSSRGLQMAKSHHSTAAMPQISSYGTSEASWGNHNDNLDASEDYFETPIQVKRLSMVAPPPAFVPITSSIRRMLETKPGKSALRKNEDTESSPQRLTFRDPSHQSRPPAGGPKKKTK